MGFFSKLKNKINQVTSQIFSGQAPMEPMIQENRQMLEAELKLSYESAEGIQALKEYGEEETPALHDALVGASEALEQIENTRKQMVETIRVGFVHPFEDLVTQWKDVEHQKHETEQAEKQIEKYENKLEKKKAKEAKDPTKIKEGEIEEVETAITDAKTNFENQKELTAQKEQALEANKLKVIKDSLGVLMKERKSFHQQSLSTLTDTKMYVDMINVENEAKLFSIADMEDETGKSGNDGSEEENKIKSKLLSMTERFMKTDLSLNKVIRENKQLLEAHQKLSKETKEGIETYKDYASKESEEIQEILSQFAGALEIIEVNRQAFIEQMKFEFIQPLEKLLTEWKALQEVIKADKNATEKVEKTQRKLEKLREKPEEKRKPEDIPEAEAALEEARTASHDAHETLQVKSHEFAVLKVTTLKDGLNSLLERNLKFHDQALNIIDSAEIFVKK